MYFFVFNIIFYVKFSFQLAVPISFYIDKLDRSQCIITKYYIFWFLYYLLTFTLNYIFLKYQALQEFENYVDFCKHGNARVN